MNKRQIEVQKAYLDSEKQVLKDLQAAYEDAYDKVVAKIKILMLDDQTQSKIYQLNYQTALRESVSKVLENLKEGNYKTVDEFLNSSYKEGFLGSMYDMYGQGVPLIIPMDPKNVVRAVKLDSKISEGLYKRMGKDVSLLKKQITSEISRGISTAMSYADIAKSLHVKTQIGFNNSARIARTEAHRIQNSAAFDAQTAAEEKGADIVKEWSAALDQRTRLSHQRADGQLVPVNKTFDIGGLKAMFPGDTGDPSEDCNCRCACLQRAKWALDQAELDTLKQRAEYFGLDKTKDFDDFKQKYMKAAEKAVQNTKNSDIIKLTEAKDFSELEKYLKKKYDITIDDAVKELNFKLCKDVMSGVESVLTEYPELADDLKAIAVKARGVMCCDGKNIYFNPQYFKATDEFEEMCKRCSSNGWWVANSTPSSIGVHETGHAVERLLLNLDTEYAYEFERIIDWNKGVKSGEIVSQALKNVKKTKYGKGKKNEELMNNISGYGATKKDETFAEAFADVYSNGDNANPLSKEIKKLTKNKYDEYKKAMKGAET